MPLSYRREKMVKKFYMETKKGTLEQSVLDVWREAADMHTEGMDGRTKEYRSHRGKLESRRTRRENKKSTVKTEQPETEHGAGERAYEIGTDRYAEYTQLITPGQLGESAREFLYDWVWDLSDEDFDNLLEAMSDEEIIALDEGIGSWIQKRTGLGPGGKAKRAGHLQKKAKKAKAKTQAIKDIDTAKGEIKKAKQARVQHKADKKQVKKDAKQAKKDAKAKAKDDGYTAGTDEPAKAKSEPASTDTKSDAPPAETGKADTVATSPDNGKDAAGGDEGQGGGGGADKGGNNGDAQAVPAKADDEKKKKTNGSGATAESVVPGFEYGHGQRLMSEELAHVRMWREAASAAVDPKEREELGMSPEGTAQKIKQAKKPAPMVASEAYTLSEIASEGFMSEGSKEEYQKFFNNAMKKFKIDSPADLKSDEEKKKFYDYVDKNYKGEKSEELLNAVNDHGDWVAEKKLALAKEFKVSSMRQALEKVWTAGAEEQEKKEAKKPKTEVHYGGEEEEEEKSSKKGQTATGKKLAAVDLEPKIKP